MQTTTFNMFNQDASVNGLFVGPSIDPSVGGGVSTSLPNGNLVKHATGGVELKNSADSISNYQRIARSGKNNWANDQLKKMGQ